MDLEAVLLETQVTPTHFERDLARDLLWQIRESLEKEKGFYSGKEEAEQVLSRCFALYRSWLEVPGIAVPNASYPTS